MTDETREERRSRQLVEWIGRWGKTVLLGCYALLTLVMVAAGLAHDVNDTGRALLVALWFSIVFPIWITSGLDR